MTKKFLCAVIVVSFFLAVECVSKAVDLVTWKTLSKLNVETGERSQAIKELEGKKIEIEGFIVPLNMDEYIDRVNEFLLVPDPFSCYHVPPPPLNQIVLVKMKKAIPLDMDARGVAIKGVLSIEKHPENEKLYSYKLKGQSAKEANIEFPDFFDPGPMDGFDGSEIPSPNESP